MGRFTLKRLPDTNEPEAPLEDDILISSKDKTIFNKWLYSNYNWLTTNIGKKGKNIKTTNASKKAEIKTLNTYDVNGDYANLLMVQPLTSVNKIDGGTGDVKGKATILSKNAPYQYIKLEEILLFIQNNLLMHPPKKTTQTPHLILNLILELKILCIHNRDSYQPILMYV
jgi:hypothetical protein